MLILSSILVTILLAFCGAQQTINSNYLRKCSIFESECQRMFFLDVLRDKYATKGLPAIGIPVIEPLKLNTEVVNIFGLWNFTFYDGVAVNISKCDLVYFKTNLDSRTKTLNMFCKYIVVRGRYKLVPTTAVQNTTFNYNGDGYLTMRFQNWRFNLKYPFIIVRHGDNKIYAEGQFDKAQTATDLGNLTIEINGTKHGEDNNDEQSNSWLNTYWRMLMGSNLGKLINDRCFEYYYGVYDTFFKRVPAATYFIDDLTPYVSN